MCKSFDKYLYYQMLKCFLSSYILQFLSKRQNQFIESTYNFENRFWFSVVSFVVRDPIMLCSKIASFDATYNLLVPLNAYFCFSSRVTCHIHLQVQIFMTKHSGPDQTNNNFSLLNFIFWIGFEQCHKRIWSRTKQFERVQNSFGLIEGRGIRVLDP